MPKRKVTVRFISPLAAFRTALILSLAGLIAWMICVVLLYVGMGIAGVWDGVAAIAGEGAVSFGMVLSIAGLMGAILAVLFSVLAPLVAIVYNATVDLFGGLELTFQD